MDEGATVTTPPASACDRQVSFDGCFNFRDLGGLPAEDGRKVRHRRAFRSDDLFMLSADDMTRIASLGVRTVVDLRTALEADGRGVADWESLGVAHRQCPLIDVLPSKEDVPQWTDQAYTVLVYHDMLAGDGRSHQELWRTVAAASRAAFVVHCASGRDRTGIVIALLLGFLGVPDEVIAADYAMTAANMEEMVRALRARRPHALELTGVNEHALRTTSAETMLTFLREFRARHESFDAYAGRLGITPEVALLRDNLLED